MENTNIRLQAMLLVTIIYCLPVRNKTIFFSSCKTCLPIICSKNNETNCSLGKEIYFVQVSFSAKCVYQTLFAEESCQNEANQGYVCFSLKKKRRSKILGFFFFMFGQCFSLKERWRYDHKINLCYFKTGRTCDMSHLFHHLRFFYLHLFCLEKVTKYYKAFHSSKHSVHSCYYRLLSNNFFHKTFSL